MDKLAVITFLVEETDNMIHKQKAYDFAHEDFRDYMKEHGGYTHETYNKARELFPAYTKGRRPSKASIEANLKTIRRLTLEVGGEL